jgi:SNF2 family DNA or RNA helicase
MAFASGSFVRLRTDPSRVGLVQPGERVRAGMRLLPVQGPDGRVSWLPADALELMPSGQESLATRVSEGAFTAPEWLRRTLARIRVAGRLSEFVYSMEATETDFYAHQFKPVLKLLNAPTDALLVADEVGLGKTIEAGLIWTELRARIDADRLLVMCPKTLCEKWRDELDRRFGVDARIVGAADLLELLKPSRRATRGFAAIASMQSLRPPRDWDRDDLDDDRESRGARQKLAMFLAESAEKEPLFDLLIVDEAHHVRNPETLLYRLAELVNAVSAHRVFLSATPIHLRNKDLFSLLKLIDPDTFEFESTLDDIIEANAPLIAARDTILRSTSTRQEIISLLSEAARYNLISASSSLKLLRDEVATRVLDRAARAEIAWRLEHVNQLANFITRTRRRDVEDLRIERVPKAPELVMHDIERVFYAEITAEVTKYARHCSANERFLLSMPQRLLTSSPAAASLWWSQFAEASEGFEADEGEEGGLDLEIVALDSRPLVRRLAARTQILKLSSQLREVDTKFALLQKELHLLWKDEPNAKVIIFSSFKPTLRYLHERITGAGVKAEILHGSVREPRDAILTRFRMSEEACVLLSSEVGSEGVDLQFCWIIINYDLPWNPMRLEQRIGRVDRLGQKREKVEVLNLIYAGTIDDRIYKRLYDRLKIGERALGEFEAVLGEPIREMTQRLLEPDLTDKQRDDIIDRAAQALENRAQITRGLEAEAGALMRHGDYILRKILEARDLNRWLSGKDILTYVRDRLERSFPGSTVETAPPGSETFRVILSIPAREALSAFLNRRNLKGATRLLQDGDRQRYRFTSSVVSANEGRIENISQMHPLVRFAAELDDSDESTLRPEPVAAIISLSDVPHPCAPGDYVIAVQRWNAADSQSRAIGTTRLAFGAAKLDTGHVVEPELAEAMVTAAAAVGKPVPNMPSDSRRERAAELLDTVVADDLGGRFVAFVRQVGADIEDRIGIRERALDRHLSTKVAGLERQLGLYRARAQRAKSMGDERLMRRNESLLAATEGRMRTLHERSMLRRAEMVAQRRITPEEVDITALLVRVS